MLNGRRGNDILVGGPGGNTGDTYADNFNTASFGNSTPAPQTGIRTGLKPAIDGDSATGGQIRIDDGNDAAFSALPRRGHDGAQIQRTRRPRRRDVGHAQLLDFDEIGLGCWTTIDHGLRSRRTARTSFRSIQITSNELPWQPQHRPDAFGTGPFTANAAIRFVASSLEAGDSVNIDNLVDQLHQPGHSTPVSTRSTAAWATTPTRSPSATATTSSTKPSRNEWRHGGSHLDPGAEHGDRSRDLVCRC